MIQVLRDRWRWLFAAGGVALFLVSATVAFGNEHQLPAGEDLAGVDPCWTVMFSEDGLVDITDAEVPEIFFERYSPGSITCVADYMTDSVIGMFVPFHDKETHDVAVAWLVRGPGDDKDDLGWEMFLGNNFPETKFDQFMSTGISIVGVADADAITTIEQRTEATVPLLGTVRTLIDEREAESHTH